MRSQRCFNIAEAIFFLSSLLPCSVLASPAVNVGLQASFPSAPYLLELLETAAEENSTAYFPLLDRIADGHFSSASTDRDLYEAFLKCLKEDGHITTEEGLDSFKFALGIHSAAPRIETHYQYYNTSVEPSIEQKKDVCDTWAAFNGKTYCDSDMHNPHGGIKDPSNAELPFDRILGNASHRLSAIVYTDITTRSFAQFHKTISKTAKLGKNSYRIRYKSSPGRSFEPLIVNGYGMHLDLKRTDYIVIDDREAGEAKRSEQQKPLKAGLEGDEITELKPLTASELSGIGMNAASFIMQSDNQLDTLLRLSQDFPKHSAAISTHNATPEFLNEHHGNRRILAPPGLSVLWINGVQVDPRKIDAFSLLDHLRRERKLISSVKDLGFTAPQAISLLSHPAITEVQTTDEPQRYDWRDADDGGNVLMWLNDIEKDKRYTEWPDQLAALLQRTYPGQLPSVRKDIHNAIVPVDFTDVEDVTLVVETLANFVKRKVPLRWALVPNVDNEAAQQQARVVYHLLETYGLAALMEYLEGSLKAKATSAPHKVTFEAVTKGRKTRGERSALSLAEVLSSSNAEARLKNIKNYLVRLGLDSDPAPILINGVAIARTEDWLQTLSNRVSADLRTLQQKIFENEFEEEDWLPKEFLAEAATHRNPLIIPEDEKNVKIVDIAKTLDGFESELSRLPTIPAATDAIKDELALMLVIGDFSKTEGANLFMSALQFRAIQDTVQVHFVHSGQPPYDVKEVYLGEEYEARLLKALEDSKATGFDGKDTSIEANNNLHPLLPKLGIKQGDEALVFNGRVIGPIDRNFTKEDYDSLFAYEMKKRVRPVARAIEALELQDKVKTASEAAKLSSLVALSTISDVPEGIFESTPTLRTSLFDKWNSSHTAIDVGDKDSATFQVTSLLDPASENAQRWTPILKVLTELSGVSLRIYLNPKDKLEELPVKRFYRYILGSAPTFNEDGSVHGVTAHFTGLPADALLTMAMDVPSLWLVAPKRSPHDLDNIKLSSLKGPGDIEATYELESILIEGHSRDTSSGMPPRGAQLVLSTEGDTHIADTIVMANLGYFQFKANPGFYKLSLQEGRSQEIFTIDSAGSKGYAAQPGDETTDIALMSFQGATLYPRVSRKPGQEEADVLEAPETTVENLANRATKFADDILAKAGWKGAKTGDVLTKPSHHADINIFSVASGHLYERMLNIMMLSVMKHTNHTVKFWFIEQFLSPSFKSFLPTLAAEYGFEFEMVTYKWPHWLRAQKEKQREIWGYKILFLDVLFPLDLDKVIFVDADQIVRTDMIDLVNVDLKGAPYGFTPMCDSRTEMEGFRFWKQGYWKNFLRGLPYHISALYVVDLKRFRAIAAGDRLRQQYHQLSADPASLSNLDQDLPNNMQMQIPIHSLPQEWLWCETWCSDESLRDAKTIDLCNNPQTKEPKLDRARRQVPEWNVYDEEIAGLARRKREETGGGEDVLAGEGAGEEQHRIQEEERQKARKHDEL